MKKTFILPSYVSHYVNFGCIELMMEAFEHRCKSLVDSSCKDSSSNCDDGDVMADVVAKLSRKQLITIHQVLRLGAKREKNSPRTNNCGQLHVENWAEVFDEPHNYEAAHGYD
jgi:hypothetical protein